jgi:hypothetical protein
MMLRLRAPHALLLVSFLLSFASACDDKPAAKDPTTVKVLSSPDQDAGATPAPAPTGGW